MTAFIAHIKIALIRRALWLVWFPFLYIDLCFNLYSSSQFNDLVWTCWDLGWNGVGRI